MAVFVIPRLQDHTTQHQDSSEASLVMTASPQTLYCESVSLILGMWYCLALHCGILHLSLCLPYSARSCSDCHACSTELLEAAIAEVLCDV